MGASVWDRSDVMEVPNDVLPYLGQAALHGHSRQQRGTRKKGGRRDAGGCWRSPVMYDRTRGKQKLRGFDRTFLEGHFFQQLFYDEEHMGRRTHAPDERRPFRSPRQTNTSGESVSVGGFGEVKVGPHET